MAELPLEIKDASYDPRLTYEERRRLRKLKKEMKERNSVVSLVNTVRLGVCRQDSSL